MKTQAPDNDSEEMVQLGEPKLVCRTSRSTLFFGFLLASLLCFSGSAVLVLGLSRLMAHWSYVLVDAVGLLLLCGGSVLCRRTNRKRHVQVVVHAAGLFYHKEDNTCLTCRWDQIESVRCRIADHHEEATVEGIIPIHSSFRTHEITLRRNDGVQMVFTDELQNIAELARLIDQRPR